jgi:hypothetical protein
MVINCLAVKSFFFVQVNKQVGDIPCIIYDLKVYLKERLIYLRVSCFRNSYLFYHVFIFKDPGFYALLMIGSIINKLVYRVW